MGRSEAHFLKGLLVSLISCFGFIIILFQSSIGIHIQYLQVTCQVFYCTHTCKAKFVETGSCILQSSDVVFNANLSIPF